MNYKPMSHVGVTAGGDARESERRLPKARRLMDGRRECAVGAWMAGVEAERSEPTAQAEGSPSGREATRTRRQRLTAECVSNAY